MRSAVYIDDNRILPARIEVRWLHEPIMQVGRSVGGFDCSRFDRGYPVAFVRIAGSKQTNVFEAARVCEIDIAGFRPGGRIVDEICAGAAQCAVMTALHGFIERTVHLSVRYIRGVMPAAQSVYCGENHLFPFGVEAQNIADQPFAFGQLSGLQVFTILGSAFPLLCVSVERRFQIHQIKMVETVALALVNKLSVVPRKKEDGMLRLYVLLVHLFVEHSDESSVFCIILAKLGVILVAVDLDEEETSLIGRPADIGEVAVGRIAHFQIDGFFGGRAVYADFHLMTGHSCHRVADIVRFGNTGGYIYQWIWSHHTFIHPVESQQVSFRAPERSFRYTELIAMYRLSADDPRRLVRHRAVVDI